MKYDNKNRSKKDRAGIKRNGLFHRWMVRLRLPAVFCYRILPAGIRDFFYCRTEQLFRKQESCGEAELRQKTDDFLITQLALLFWGLLCIFLIWQLILAGGIFDDNGLMLKRGRFGTGSRTVSIKLEQGEQSTEVELQIEETILSKEEQEEVFNRLFEELEQVMRGRNESLRQVCYDLNFPDKLSGYPFALEYEVLDSSVIGLNGSLDESVRKMKEGTRDTVIIVTACYGQYEKAKRYEIVCVPAEAEKPGPFARVIEALKARERETREQETFSLKERIHDFSISVSGEQDTESRWLFLAGIVLFGAIYYRYYHLKETVKAEREQAVTDFPLVVHLLTLYLGAGLSLSSAIQRISEEYQKGRLTAGEEPHRVFQEMTVMNQRILNGVSQKKALELWSDHMEDPMYRKLVTLLIQSLSKGSAEIRLFMGTMEQEAFRGQIDYARKKGEEASTKMLFPMVILMGTIMLLVMFPALIQLRQF